MVTLDLSCIHLVIEWLQASDWLCSPARQPCSSSHDYTLTYRKSLRISNQGYLLSNDSATVVKCRGNRTSYGVRDEKYGMTCGSGTLDRRIICLQKKFV